MSNSKKRINEGYQPQKNNGYWDHRGYQPKPSGDFGYQPIKHAPEPPKPPISGSNISKIEKTKS